MSDADQHRPHAHHALNEDGSRQATRFSLALAGAGALVVVLGYGVLGDDYITITGGALTALGLGAAGLLRMLFH